MAKTIDWDTGLVHARFAVDEEARLTLVNFGPSGNLGSDLGEWAALGPVEIQFAGSQLPQGSRHVALGGTLALKYESHSEETAEHTSSLSLVQRSDEGVLVEQRWQSYTGLPVVRCTVAVTNKSQRPVVLDHVASFTYNGFGRFAQPNWSDDIRLAIPHNTLFGEFQWVSNRLPDLGVWGRWLHGT